MERSVAVPLLSYQPLFEMYTQELQEGGAGERDVEFQSFVRIMSAINPIVV